MKNLLIALLFLSTLLFTSCNPDDTSRLRTFENGVFIVNEGNFQEEDGSISFYDGQEVTQGVFQTVNGFTSLGSVVQSLTLDEDRAYIVVNNSNKIEVVNSRTFESITTLDALQPRYLAIEGGAGYLTEWVSFSEPGQVSIVDVSQDLTPTTRSIDVGFTPEDIKVVKGSLYITEAFGNRLYEVDIQTQAVTTHTVNNGPEQMVVDANDNLWIACEGGSDVNFAPLNNGSIVHFNTTTKTIDQTFELNTNYQGKIAINAAGNSIVVPVNAGVYRFEIGATAFPDTPIIADPAITSIYGVGIDPENGDIYLGDSKSFADDGEVFIYDAAGQFKTSFTVGRGPNGFVFN